ncbi:hypothetical protein GCM10023322_07650 [Rugosimonospora acidiphila]|uniref:Dyp-type peroxidase C-terminal domain-containing protein n=1 Tax=Rugosimonospora acidiphila TaxID=556531 RepID=A0ABP9RJL9_9ACTN
MDTTPAPYLAVVQADLPGADPDACATVLRAVVRGVEGAGFAAGFGPPPAPTATYLLGVSARLLKGPWTPWRDDADDSSRWGRPVRCPASLRAMQAKRDNDFPSFRTDQQRVGHETDLIALLESADPEQLSRAVREMSGPLGGAVREHRGQLRPQGRDPFGFHDGVSNLQDLRAEDPRRYEEHLIHREADLDLEGTYLVFRRYRLFPQRMRDPVVVPDDRGEQTRTLTPEQVIGRCRSCGSVLDADTGDHLPRRAGEAQGASALRQSHLRKANPRGRGLTNFGHEVVPPDVRLLRRGYPTSDPEGLLFLAFQADIQDGGFEFIHNEWLLSDFNGAPDPLLSPEAGLVEPLTGCYYFVPRAQRDLGEVLRTLVTSAPVDGFDGLATATT